MAVRSSDEVLPEAEQASGMEEDDKGVIAQEEVGIEVEDPTPERSRVCMKEVLGQGAGEGIERVGRQGGDPGVEGNRVLAESWTPNIPAALVVARGSGIDEGVVEQDAIGLLVMLPGAELVHQIEARSDVVAEDPRGRASAACRGGPVRE
jgi:hypothetical protein